MLGTLRSPKDLMPCYVKILIIHNLLSHLNPRKAELRGTSKIKY